MNKDFIPFPKMARLYREIIITEKIDGTNSQVYITKDGEVYAGSRTRWITPQSDNMGFAAWVEVHEKELLKLGPGRHFGEWWGSKIQRGYGLKERRFSLFNTSRWHLNGEPPRKFPGRDERGNDIVVETQELPACVGLVPELYRGMFSEREICLISTALQVGGSVAAPGFMNPEGIVVYHVAAGVGFKRTFDSDGIPKSRRGVV